MIKKCVFLCVFLLSAAVLPAQKYTISGYIEDAESGERLPGAGIYNPDNNSQGTVANTYGFFSLTLPRGDISLKVSYVGYAAQALNFNLESDTFLIVKLNAGTELEEVVVESDNPVKSSRMSEVDIPVKAILKMPVLLGETDVLKTVQLLPGVQSGMEGTGGFYVRGGSTDQNLILLDGVPVYNVNHLFGFFSVFNGYAIKDVTLVKGGFPARYGGRLSSVLDIRMKEGNMKKIRGEASSGIIASKISVEGPIIKDKTSFIVSGRRTYLDLLAQPFIRLASSSNTEGSFRAGYFFYDINAKINHKFSQRDRLYLSVYGGKDKAYIKTDNQYQGDSFQSDFDLHWGNLTSALRWNHIFSSKLFANLTFTYSDYRFVTAVSDEWSNNNNRQEWAVEYYSGIEDLALKIDADYSPAPSHNIKFGASGIYHVFKPGISAFRLDGSDENMNIDTTFGSGNLYAKEFVVYAEDDFRPGKRFKFNIGAHFSGFQVRDTLYLSLQPRFSARFLVTDKFSLKASYVHMAQYLHFLTNSTVGLPTDLWLPATDLIGPQYARQYAAGLAIDPGKNLELTLEGFYKEMDNLIEYEEGAGFFSDPESGAGAGEAWEQKIETGRGWSYGAEIMLQKKTGRLSGWLAYTWAKSERQFENIAFGQRFPFRYDRRHDISINLAYEINDRIDVALTWVYGTGNAVTLATQRYMPVNQVPDYTRILENAYGYDYYYQTVEYYGTRNNYRLPAYHRLDLGINFTKEKNYGYRTWSLGVYNAYNRKNPFFVDFSGEFLGYNKPEQSGKLVKYSLFPLIPSINYTYKLK